ncbi:DUF359 domain-containing protein [Thermogladius sp.]|uniref:DUF359 domain-containing protein n=1 Tax=Thermogladius sp. TaxID=2023064 RepID=UPI003D0C78CB
MFLPSLVLREEFRRSASLPQGTLYVAPEEGTVRGLKFTATVGDVVSETLESSIKVVDGKTRRGDHRPGAVGVANIVNPRGAVSLHSLTVLRGSRGGTYVVLGEEDLLTTSLAWVLSRGTIAYGQPGVGVVSVEVDKVRLAKFIKVLKPAIIHITPGRA